MEARVSIKSWCRHSRKFISRRNWKKLQLVVVSQFFLVNSNIFAKYRWLGQDVVTRGAILMVVCSLLQNRWFCATLNSAVLSHFRSRRFCPVSEIGGFVSIKIGRFVLPFCNSPQEVFEAVMQNSDSPLKNFGTVNKSVIPFPQQNFRYSGKTLCFKMVTFWKVDHRCGGSFAQCIYKKAGYRRLIFQWICQFWIFFRFFTKNLTVKVERHSII